MLIRKISKSETVDDHIEIVAESLNSIHKGKPKAEQFLSAAHLSLFYKYLTPVPKFEKLLPMYQEQYDAVKGFVKHLAGCNYPKTLSCFLRSQFPCLASREISWNTIFAYVDTLANSTESLTYKYEMKKLIDKFTNGQAIEFFMKMYPEVAEIDILDHQILQDLKVLCNHIANLGKKKSSNYHLQNFRRSVLACFVSTHQKTQLQRAGWNIEQKL